MCIRDRVRLRDLEVHEGLNKYFNNAIENCVKSIVGVQFRNCATIGGSIFSRFGFSDPLTCLLALDSYVKLYKGGVISMREFVNMPYDLSLIHILNPILVFYILLFHPFYIIYLPKE